MDIEKTMRLLHGIKDSGFSSDELKKAFHDLKELNEYRKIGTVDECRAAVDRIAGIPKTWNG